MTWVTITGAGITTATKFFGDALNKINNMFNTVDVSDIVKINAAVTWTFDGNSFRVRDSNDDASYIFVGGDLAADRNVNLPVLTAGDTIAFVGFPNSYTATQTFQDDGIEISNPADTFQYLIQAAAIAADRTLTLPLLTGPDTLVTEAFPQPLTNKTMDGDLNTFIDINETQMNVSVGVSGTVLTSTGVGSPPTYQTAAAALPVVDTTSIAEGSGDATKEVRFEVDGNNAGIVGIIATIFTTAKTITLPDATDTLVGKATTDDFTNKKFVGTTNLFEDNALRVENPATTFDYLIQAGAITADRTFNLPVITASDTFNTLGLAQTISSIKTHSEDIFFNTQTKGVINIDTQTKTQKSQYTTDNAGNILVSLVA